MAAVIIAGGLKAHSDDGVCDSYQPGSVKASAACWCCCDSDEVGQEKLFVSLQKALLSSSFVLITAPTRPHKNHREPSAFSESSSVQASTEHLEDIVLCSTHWLHTQCKDGSGKVGWWVLGPPLHTHPPITARL